MLKPEQVPDVIAREAEQAYFYAAEHNSNQLDGNVMKHAIAAAINAWPGVHRYSGCHDGVGYDQFILPFPHKDDANAEG